ncbi:MAG: DNA polymerase IV [Eubacteriales bacterium]|nr:DNA polymerase IV [Eubacteriales bacterium]
MRIIFHADVNSAFLSWEAVRRLKNGEEDIRLFPSAIGGDSEKRKGVILAKSHIAKKFGVQTGEPVAHALRKCPALKLYKPDFKLYSENSRLFMGILNRFSPKVEQFSIDECFLDMTGIATKENATKFAKSIQSAVFEELGFTINVGIGDNKVLAKTASDFEKPNKIHTLFIEEISEKLWPLPVRRLLFVGSKTEAKLKSINIFTVGDLAHVNSDIVCRLLGNKAGIGLKNYANGIDLSEVCAHEEKPKSISNSTTLEKDIAVLEDCFPVLLWLTDNVAMRLRQCKGRAQVVSVVARRNDFVDLNKQLSLLIPTDNTNIIYEHAKKLLKELFFSAKPVRLLGVGVSRLSFDGLEQTSLFEDPKGKKQRMAQETIDQIRRRFGNDTIVRAGTLKKEEQQEEPKEE